MEPRTTAPARTMSASRMDEAPPVVQASLAREVASSRPASAPADLNAITGRWDELVARMRADGKVLLGAALEASSPHAITKSGDLTIKLDEPNDFHARAIEQDTPAILAALRDWFAGVARIVLYREAESQPQAKQQRLTDEIVKSERLNGLKKKDPVLGAAIDVLDLEIAD